MVDFKWVLIFSKGFVLFIYLIFVFDCWRKYSYEYIYDRERYMIIYNIIYVF